jgi:putative tryptophan/tyrosine transport system substrate-binding protein
MRRRQFIALLGGVAARPFATLAQQTGRVYRVGWILHSGSVSETVGPDPIGPLARTFVHALRDRGYIEGHNLVLERRSAEGKIERFPEILRDLLSHKVDVIVTTAGNNFIQAANELTRTDPIVTVLYNPVEQGLVQSLARPGGNITGLTILTGQETVAKKVQILKEILPSLSRVAFLQTREAGVMADWEQITAAVTRELGVKLLFADLKPLNFADTFASILRDRADALLVTATIGTWPNRRLIFAFAAQNRIPAIYPSREFAADGGLIAYGVEYADLQRRLAGYVRILRGTKPADLPIEQPTKWELVINLKTAKVLGLTVPPSLLARADEVIE